MPAAVGEEPMPRPTSTLPAATAVLISAPEPTSLQVILVPAICSHQPALLASMVGWVARKKATLTLSGALPAASRLRAGRPATRAAALSVAVPMNTRRLARDPPIPSPVIRLSIEGVGSGRPRAPSRPGRSAA